MNVAVNALYAEYLKHTDNDKAAASLALAAVLMDNGGPAPLPEAALTVAEAANRLKVAGNTVYDLVEPGELTHHRIGRTSRILSADIDAYQRHNVEAARPRPSAGDTARSTFSCELLGSAAHLC